MPAVLRTDELRLRIHADRCPFTSRQAARCVILREFMGPVIERLSAVCREHPLREKVLVAPSLAIGHQVADAIAREGTQWINLRIETVRTIADATAGFDIAQRGLTVLSRAQALAFVERACDRVLDESSYFAALAGRPGLHRAIQRSIDDLRHAGARAEDLAAKAFEDPGEPKRVRSSARGSLSDDQRSQLIQDEGLERDQGSQRGRGTKT